jgi:cytochrome c-type biogenesis protein CcmF
LTALIGLVGRNKRRYGGYIVHLGIVLMFLGFAGAESKKDEQVLLKPGQQTTVGRYTVRNDGIKVTDDGQKQMITAHIAVFEGGKQIDDMYPAKWHYRKHEEQPTTEVAIRRTIPEDLYLVLSDHDMSTQTASLQIVVNPLIDWIWFGFGVMAIGTGIALLPERAFSFAIAKLPAADAAAATTALLLAVFLSGTTLFAQGENVQVVPRSDLERKLQNEISCTCGCRLPLDECGMINCEGRGPETAKIRQLLSEGKTHDEVLATFIKDYGGQDILSAPLDRGFNRLAWLFPYMLGATGIVLVGVAAIRWSRHTDAPRAAAPSEDPALEERLDDELRDLD